MINLLLLLARYVFVGFGLEKIKSQPFLGSKCFCRISRRFNYDDDDAISV